MRICRTCCYPDTKPDLHFDETGECSACRNYANRPTIDWAARKSELLQLLDKHDGRCVVPSSGGKDSHAQALMLRDLGADVVTVTATTCMLTAIGRQNLDNLARYVPGYEHVPNKTVRAKLNRLGLELVGDISWPEHAAIFSMAFKGAMDLGRRLVFMGECPQTEYGGPQGSEDAKRMTLAWLHEFGGFLGLRASDFVGMEGITARDMEPYAPPSVESVAAAGVEVHFLGSYLPWDSRQNAELAREHGMLHELPFRGNWWDSENLDNAMTGLHDYFGYLKYGYSRGCAQINVDVRSGRIERQKAINFLDRYQHLFPDQYAGVAVEDVLDHIGMTRPELDAIAERFKC